MAISAKMVKELRERTGLGMMECKKFLQECDGDIDNAIEAIRKSGAVKAVKMQGRIAAEGLTAVRVANDGKTAVIIEVNCETDFVSRGDDFADFVNLCTEQALAHRTATVEALAAVEVNGETIDKARENMIVKIGENINIRRVDFVEAKGSVMSYIHGARIAVLVDAETPDDGLAKDLAMHIAASNPAVIAGEDVPEEMINKEKEIYSAQAAESGKPADIVEKMVAGRIRKYLEEVSLLGQPFVKDPSTTVGDLLKSNNAKVHAFIRYEVGEGIEKKQEDFAAEVMAQVKGN